MRIVAFLALWSPGHLNGLEFRDAKGQMDQIPSHLVGVFYESEQGQTLKTDVQNGQLIDFSGFGLTCLQGMYIKDVLEYAHNIEHLRKKEVALDEMHLLDTANCLGVKQKELLYHLANRVWGYLKTSKQKQELHLSEFDQAYVRKIAKPYLNSPEKFLRANKKLFWFHRKNSFTCFDFSFETLNKNYDQEYPFVFSAGLADLIYKYCISALAGENLEYKIDIDLSGHAIQDFIIDDWIEKVKQLPKITVRLNLSHNTIERIRWSRMPSNLVYEKLNFSYNPVTCLDESVYSLMHSYRSRGLRSKLLIPHNRLSTAEIALAKQQWYYAVNTLVDRYSKGHNPDGLGVLAGLLVVSGSALADYATKSNGSILLLAGLGGGMASWLTLHLRYLPRLAHMMAIQTHPEIEKPGAHFHRPLGNTWLEDWQKPQLILKKENDAS